VLCQRRSEAILAFQIVRKDQGIVDDEESATPLVRNAPFVLGYTRNAGLGEEV